jgi:hypothetical protein
MILKIIGIILLVLILLALVLLLLVLCTPLRYRVQGAYHDGKPDVEAKIHIWFSALAVYAAFTEAGFALYLRIFGIRKYLVRPPEETNSQQQKVSAKSENLSEQSGSLNQENESELGDISVPGNESEPADISETGAVSESEDISEAENVSELKYSVQPEEHTETADTAKAENETGKAADTEKTEKKPDKTADPEKEQPSVSEKLQGVLEKCSGVVNKIKALYEKAQNLYASLQKKKEAVAWFWKKASTKHMLVVFKNQGIKIIKSILPRTLTGELTLGLEDPAAMGQICMFGGMFYPMYEKHFKFTPVFGESRIDGEGYLKGRVILGAILAHLLRVLLVRDFYRFLKNVKILIKKIK